MYEPVITHIEFVTEYGNDSKILIKTLKTQDHVDDTLTNACPWLNPICLKGVITMHKTCPLTCIHEILATGLKYMQHFHH